MNCSMVRRIMMFSLLGLLLASTDAVAQTTHIVTVGDNFFSPSELTIQVGDTVEWRNAAGGNPHNVTADDSSFASTTASSFTFSRTFNEAGVVGYSCTIHSGMTGTITVTAASNNFAINIGMMDAWFDEATDGQGFLITVYPQSKIMFVAWFTFDTERPPEDAIANFGEAGHRWVTASGPYDGDTAMLDVFLSTGGTLDSPQPPVFTDPVPYGSMTITWTDCNTALLSYDIPSLGLMGEIVIERAFPENVPVCEAGQVMAE